MTVLPDVVADVTGRVEAALTAHLDVFLPRIAGLHASLSPLADELRGFMAGGKRLRPVLLALGHRAAGGDDSDVMGPAVAVELLHTCALLHDDVIDAAPARRGRPTAHVAFAAHHRRAGLAGDADRYGEAVAVLLGDLAFVAADEAFLRGTVPPQRLLRGLRWFGRLREEVMAGQVLDVQAAAARTTDPALALQVATLKSGRYSVTRPLQIGAVLAGADDALLAGLEDAGDPLGRAFQLRDDLLGVFGDETTTGKSVSGDLAEGKRTLLVAEAFQRLDRDGRERLEAALGDRDIDAATTTAVRALLEDSGARRAVEERIHVEIDRARAAIGALPTSTAMRRALTDVADWLVAREA